MTRLLFCALLLAHGVIWAEDQRPSQEEPPEEDTSQAPKEYTFNPIQAEKEFKVGSFYLKKGSYRAAVRRFEEALKWDQNMAEAYIKIGDAQTKLGNTKAANQAYKKYLELKPDAKDASDIRKKLR